MILLASRPVNFLWIIWEIVEPLVPLFLVISTIGVAIILLLIWLLVAWQKRKKKF